MAQVLRLRLKAEGCLDHWLQNYVSKGAILRPYGVICPFVRVLELLIDAGVRSLLRSPLTGLRMESDICAKANLASRCLTSEGINRPQVSKFFASVSQPTCTMCRQLLKLSRWDVHFSWMSHRRNG